eukprot:8173858-Alexandrium_andersonii.AAC.1
MCIRDSGSPPGEATQETAANRCELIEALKQHVLLSNTRWPNVILPPVASSSLRRIAGYDRAAHHAKNLTCKAA